MNKRKDFIDVAKGIAIILTITGHTLSHAGMTNFIYSFHMPIFFILSGMLWKERDFKKNIISWMRGLLVPYVITATVMCLYYYARNLLLATEGADRIQPGIVDILLGVSGRTTLVPSAMGFGFVWFFVCMFVTKVLFELILHMTSTEKQRVFVVGVSMVLGYAISKIAMLPWSVDIALVCVGFMYVGYLLRGDRFERYFIIGKYRYFAWIACAVVWLVGMWGGSVNLAWRTYPNGLGSILGAAGGSMLVLVFSYYISKAFIIKKGLTFWGRNSMVILCIHTLEYFCFPWEKVFLVLNILLTELLLFTVKIVAVGIAILLYDRMKKMLFGKMNGNKSLVNLKN